MTAFIDYLFASLALVFALMLVGAYARNIWKLILDMRAASYSIKTVARGIGVFVPVIGVIMGFV